MAESILTTILTQKTLQMKCAPGGSPCLLSSVPPATTCHITSRPRGGTYTPQTPPSKTLSALFSDLRYVACHAGPPFCITRIVYAHKIDMAYTRTRFFWSPPTPPLDPDFGYPHEEPVATSFGNHGPEIGASNAVININHILNARPTYSIHSTLTYFRYTMTSTHYRKLFSWPETTSEYALS